jgi:hypothetical protein
MKSDEVLARAIFYGMDTYKSIASMQKIFILWMKNEIRYVTGKNLLTEMMKYKPVKITRIK